jgi:hypothetical protein
MRGTLCWLAQRCLSYETRSCAGVNGSLGFPQLLIVFYPPSRIRCTLRTRRDMFLEPFLHAREPLAARSGYCKIGQISCRRDVFHLDDIRRDRFSKRSESKRLSAAGGILLFRLYWFYDKYSFSRNEGGMTPRGRTEKHLRPHSAS